MTTAYIGVGSNVGDRAAFCRSAVKALEGTQGISVEKVSSLYETSPVGGPPQRSYVNLVTKLDTDLTAQALLDACKMIERKIGREPSDIRWGPRVVDLDILIFGDEKIGEPHLEVPHPHIRERRFVLVPLLEVEQGAVDPWGDPYAGSIDDAEGEVEFLEPY
ncbi:MAG TPA: 2-amino-4-hydroxy-6-hydroxymethyldihydropteridine diphosphokinase [Actinomycetota bacterium]|nr:2-amino-4-hydroxy-6-hydroxymethyldihydropteridine diphosphokinase [Actinomycetota bacterium]